MKNQYENTVATPEERLAALGMTQQQIEECAAYCIGQGRPLMDLADAFEDAQKQDREDREFKALVALAIQEKESPSRRHRGSRSARRFPIPR